MEVAALGDQAIGAGLRYPFEGRDIVRRQHDAIGHMRVAIGVVTTTALVAVIQLAGDIGVQVEPGILVFQLDQTAFAAMVAQ